ncbi:MAG: DUF5309 domain-containing protein [Desulfarculaceae bacterium]|nr:DUF5309 domain-containing protein [Desulfarculaceae bacterium]
MATVHVDDFSTVKRDLTDLITNISPTATPLLTMLGKKSRKAINTLVETMQDSLADAAENAHVDGSTFSEVEHTPPGVTQSYAQNFLKWVIVPDTLQDVQIQGMKKAYTYFSKKAMKEIARDIEKALMSQVPQGPQQPRKLTGLTSAITTNVIDAGGAEPLTEDGFNDLLQLAWDEGGEPSVVFVNSIQKRVISQFTGGTVKNIDAAKKKLVLGVDYLDTDFGEVKVVPTRYLAHSEMLAIDPNLWELAWLRRVEHVPMAKDGDRTRGMIRGRLALGAKEEKGNAFYKGLTY